MPLNTSEIVAGKIRNTGLWLIGIVDVFYLYI